ncbi:MAG: hypothetical protein KatS3mg091_213 [Patescibacteria group bacterium]|nr:MAG: hypothetical protein KatS3mg091_213 [Patescibacteria group bacterium]
MGDFNKIFAIILGGIITIAILVFVISRLANVFKGANFQLPKVFQNQTEPTPTPTPFETIIVNTDNDTESPTPTVPQRSVQGTNQYPDTGPENYILLLTVALISLGVYFRRLSS